MSTEMPNTAQILDAMRSIMDPEAGIDIVEMGLVYAVDCDAQGVRISMTTTSPACPTGSMMMDEAQAAVSAVVPPGMKVEVVRVWEPPWDPSRLSDAAKKKLGW